MARAGVVLACITIVVVVLAAGLRPDAFFVGDPGVKLIAARNALHSPSHPLSIPLPHIGSGPVPHVEPFFEVHGDHAHAVTSELFPLLSAPFLALAEVRGLYVLPAVGFVLTLAACAWFSTTLDRRRSPALVIASAALGTPFLFYGLEFWEHTLALACGIAGGALFLTAAPNDRHRSGAVPLAVAAGLMSGVAILLRPEAACFSVAVLIASLGTRRLTTTGVVAAFVGATIAVLPLELYTALHFGSLVPHHVGTNAALVADGHSWVSGRMLLIREWLVPSTWNASGPRNAASMWTVSPAAILAIASLAWGDSRSDRRFLWMVALVDVALVIVLAPNAGGGQWGPRYLLFAFVPFALLATDVVQRLPVRRASGALVLVLLVVSCVWVQRAAYRRLRGAKTTYGRIVDFVETTAPAGSTIVTDAWWFDQLAASTLDSRTLLFARDVAEGRGIVSRLNDNHVSPVVVVRSREESIDLSSWATGTCYEEASRQELSVRSLEAVTLVRKCAGEQ